MIRWIKIQRCKLDLHSAEAKRRVAALRRLFLLKVPNAQQLLISALGDSDSAVRQAAADQLSRSDGVSSVEPLIVALNGKDSKVRKIAAELLGKTSDTRAIDPLIRTLRDDDRAVRQTAAEMLSRIGGSRATEPLIAALDDIDSGVRRISVIHLGKVADTRSIDLLTKMLRDSDSAVRHAAVDTLSKCPGPGVVQPLIDALAVQDAYVCRIAAKCLGHARDSRAIGPLVLLLDRANKLPGMIRHFSGQNLWPLELFEETETLEEVVAEALQQLSSLHQLRLPIREKVEMILRTKREREDLSAKVRSSFPDSHGSSNSAMLSTSPETPRTPWGR